jgi:hypothetical protein
MALNAVQQVVNTGLNPSMAAAAAGDEFIPGQNIMLYIFNGSGGSITGTVVTVGTVAGQAITDLPIVVAAGARVLAGPFPYDIFANPADGRADISWSATPSVTWAAVQL